MTETAEKRSIVVEAEMPYPVEKVWRALTDSECIALWFMKNDLVPEFGHKFTFAAGRSSAGTANFKCQVLEVEENQKISFAWKGGHAELKSFGRYIDTMATWTIAPNADGGTHVRFEHDGFDTCEESNGCYEAMTKGAQSIVRTLNKMIPDFDE